jgi:hypothetical protein
MLDYSPPPTDAYGFQETDGNGTYDPNLVTDSSGQTQDLTNVPVTPATATQQPNCCNPNGCEVKQVGGTLATQDHWTDIGEFNGAWNEMGDFTWAVGSTTTVGALVGYDGKDFGLVGSASTANTSSTSQTEGNIGPNNSNLVQAYMVYNENKYGWYPFTGGKGGGVSSSYCAWYDQWGVAGITQNSDGENVRIGPSIFSKQNKSDTRWRTDGLIALENVIAVKGHGYPHANAWGFNVCLSSGKGETYGFAATVAGNGVWAETNHTSSTTQCVASNAANGMPDITRNDAYSGNVDNLHISWGSNHPFRPDDPSALVPGTIYCY